MAFERRGGLELLLNVSLRFVLLAFGRGGDGARNDGSYARRRMDALCVFCVLYTCPSKDKRMPGFFIAVFQGMYQTACDDSYELALIAKFKSTLTKRGVGEHAIHAKCFSPPKRQSSAKPEKPPFEHWADYTEQGQERYETTANVENVEGELWTSMANGSWDWLKEQEAAGRTGIVVGVSNGGVPAAAVALYFGSAMVKSLLLVSALPAKSQQEPLVNYYRGHIMMTVGSHDATFGGRTAMYAFAASALADVRGFHGYHCKESTQLLKELGKWGAHSIVQDSVGGEPAATMTTELPPEPMLRSTGARRATTSQTSGRNVQGQDQSSRGRSHRHNSVRQSASSKPSPSRRRLQSPKRHRSPPQK